ncbi:hypothetical protein [Solibacillus sp. FSL K6-1126]|uniref:hypothetical protein n=1 Tax=Solibacillus sp. FSL K6-1126 TaxID=2921463 RepID=UPI0030F858A0
MRFRIFPRIDVKHRLHGAGAWLPSKTNRSLTIYIYGLLGGELVVYMYDIVSFHTFKPLTIAHPYDKLTL